jgi:hypothetical protein
MNRKQRRVLAHANRKASVQTVVSEEAPDTVQQPTSPNTEVSDAQLDANRRNAQLSTGPTTPEGKAKVGRNAIKHNLTGNQLLIPTADAPRYEALVADYQKEFQPVGPEETYLLQSIIDIRWRLAGIPALESALLDLAKTSLIELVPAMAANPPMIFDMQARIHREKEFRNLHLQEQRLVRRRESEMKELRALQAARKAAEAQKEEMKAKEMGQTATAPAQNGFVFSTAQIIEHVVTLSPEAQQDFLMDVLTSIKPLAKTMEAAA